MRLRKSLSFTRRRHRRKRHTRLWPMCIRVLMDMICNFRNYNYWTGNAIGFRASRELCSNFLFSSLHNIFTRAIYRQSNIKKNVSLHHSTLLSTRTRRSHPFYARKLNAKWEGVVKICDFWPITRCISVTVRDRKSYTGCRLAPNSMTLDDLERQNRGFYRFFPNIGLRKSISFTRRRHRRQRHTRLWPMCIMVPMGRVQVICDFRNYNYWTGNAIGFRASRELFSNFLLLL